MEISILETGKMIKDIITVPFKSYHYIQGKKLWKNGDEYEGEWKND